MADHTAAAVEAGPMRLGACDQCRKRKIKCDRSDPCANCRTANRVCSNTGPNAGGTRQRVLISSQYELKIDRIADRLSDIERLLQNVISTIESPPRESSNFPSTTSRYDRSNAIRLAQPTDEPAQLFEGGSSLTAHTNLVSNLVSHTVKQTNLPGLNPDIQAALSALRHITERQYRKANSNEVGFSNQKPLPPGGFRELPMPPLELVLHILRDMKENGAKVPFALHCIFISVERFTEYCRQVYFATEEFDLTTFIVVNGGLFYAFGGRALVPEGIDDPDARAEYLHKYRNMCADNMVAALGSLSLFMPASAVNIEALLLGTNYAIEASRPSLAWKMSNIAAQMCQTLGYHQMPPLTNTRGDTTDHERRIDTFRYTYKLNKALALRLGRVSAFQDYDISIPICSIENCGGNLWRRVIAARVRHAQVQGEIYDQLYSSKALLASLEQRIRYAMALAESMKAMVSDLDNIRNEFGRVRTTASLKRTTDDASELILGSEMVSYHSSLTLIYRSVPQNVHTSNSFAGECIEAARVAFQHHHECMQLAMSPIAQSGYIHWTLLFAPFTPLIVMFCHAIETLDEDDLRQLEEFTLSIEHVCPLSEAIEQLHRLAQALHNIAFLYVKAKMSHIGMQDTVPLERDFEAYLTQLGLTVPGTGPATVSSAANGATQSAPLGGWFAGNVTMMGLLEEDLTGFFP